MGAFLGRKAQCLPLLKLRHAEKPVPFSEKIHDDAQYLRNAALLLAISYEMAFHKMFQ
jgi:hypothetical protein